MQTFIPVNMSAFTMQLYIVVVPVVVVVVVVVVLYWLVHQVCGPVYVHYSKQLNNAFINVYTYGYMHN